MATDYTEAQIDAANNCGLYELDPTKHMGKKILYFKTVTINPTEINTAQSFTATNTDIYQALEITSGEVVIFAGINTRTIGVSGCLADLGFAGGDNFVLNQDIGDVSLPAGTGYKEGPMYIEGATNKDTLDIQLAAQVATGAEFQVWALIARVGFNPSS